jgi:conjugal transfer pilus assembly protein TraW
MLKRRLQSLDIAHHQKEMQKIARKSVEEPKPLSGIGRASKTITHSFDPSYVLDEDIILPCGKVLHRAGTVINPLDHMSWSGRLIFIDARDKEQVQWLQKELVYLEENQVKEVNANASTDKATGENTNTKIILTGGKPFEIENMLDRKVYFDQFGELTGKFNIQNVPAIAEQDGKMLKITEIDIGNNYALYPFPNDAPNSLKYRNAVQLVVQNKNLK